MAQRGIPPQERPHHSHRGMLNPGDRGALVTKPVCLVALLLVAFSLAAKEKEKNAPLKVIANATSVFITTFSGDEPANPERAAPRMVPSDRKAQADVEEALRKWGR